MYFIGIDLAWKVKELKTAIAVLDSKCSLVDNCFVTTDEELLSLVMQYDGNGLLIGIDAPLTISDSARLCEVMLRKCGIPVLPVSRRIFVKHYNGMRGVELRKRLEAMGIPLIDSVDWKEGVSGLFEIYPYASWKIAFNWDFKGGKKMPVRERKTLLKMMRARLFSMLPRIKKAKTLSFDVQKRDINSMCSLELTAMNDMLDAIMGAYTLFNYWMYGTERTALVGRTGEAILTLADEKLRRRLELLLSPDKQTLP